MTHATRDATAEGAAPIPQFDLADRLRKGLREADLDVQEMAAYLGVSRTSVSNWINGRIKPSLQTQRLWAMRTGVPFEWLRDGDAARSEADEVTGVGAAPRPRRGGHQGVTPPDRSAVTRQYREGAPVTGPRAA